MMPTRGTKLAGAIALVFLGAGLVAVAACENQRGTYVYRGRRFNGKCLEPTRALDVIEIEVQPALCAPVCLTQNDYDGGRSVYVSNVCPPYPPGFDTSGQDPLCLPALIAADDVDSCLPDGGADADAGPALPDASDAGPDADDASPDASDAGADADDSGPDASDASDAG